MKHNAILLPLLWGISVSVAGGAATPEWVSAKDGRFVDASGRHVMLHGVNVDKKSPPYFTEDREEGYARMASWGFNCIRLAIFWAALEPQCGVYDEKYLAALDERIAWARASGMWVLVDLHQDLWGEGKCRGDGAPAWAAIDDGKPYADLGFVWSDAYLASGAIQSAFDHFWANSPAPDGQGLQDHLARAWKMVAERYKDEPTVVGYDLLNEPFVGSPIMKTLTLVMEQIATLVRDQPLGLDSLLNQLTDIERYRRIVDSTAPVFQQFEKEKLGPYHQRMADAIRSVDRRHILFIEPSVSANQGVPSALPPVLTRDGAPDPQQALAPHIYDIVADGPTPELADGGRLGFIFDRHQETSIRLKVPVLVGEWGAFYGSSKVLPAARMSQRQFERTLFGDLYWDLHGNFDKTSYFETLERPYPMAVAGILREYEFNPETQVFQCTWEEDPATARPTVIFLPARWFANIELPSDDAHIEPVVAGSSNRLLFIPVGTEKRTRNIRLSAAKN